MPERGRLGQWLVVAGLVSLATIGCAAQAPSTKAPVALSPSQAKVPTKEMLLANTCSGCHRADAPATNSRMGSLRNYSTAQLTTLLLSYQRNPDGQTVMHRIARGYSDAELQAVAEHLGSKAP